MNQLDERPAPAPHLPSLPPRIAKLPRNTKGMPVPYFVAWIDGKPDFRMVRPETARDARVKKLCWICGEPLGASSTFAIGPMCVVNRTSAEPPSHRECAEFAVKACPFMLHPNMVRREDEMTREMADNTPGITIRRNPGVMCLWTVKEWKIFNDGKGGTLFNIGEPRHVSWWREGRRALREEVYESIQTGVPLLRAMCFSPGDHAELARRTLRAIAIVDRTTPPP